MTAPPWRVPMVDLAARHAARGPAVEAAVLEVLRSGRYIGGPAVAAAEAALAARLGRAHGVGAGSGTDALVLGLLAAGLQPGDEVIVPAVSFFSTAGAVVRAGGVPVVVDVGPGLPLICPEALARAAGPRTRAVIPVHLYGHAADLPEGAPVGAFVLDDAAQALGATPPVGQGVAAALSLYPTKVLGVAGDGGLLATDDPALAARARRLGSHGQDGPHHHVLPGGFNSRLDAAMAAVALALLPGLDAELDARRRQHARVAAAVPGVLPAPAGGSVGSLIVLPPSRDRLQAALAAAGIESVPTYPRALSDQPALRALAADGRARLTPCPRAAAFCARALAVPCRGSLSEDDVQLLISTLIDALGPR